MFPIAKSLFKTTTPEKVLKKNLYDFRQKVNDAEFHFVIGVAMLQLGYLWEACTAFKRSRDIGDFQKSQLFLCIALMHAERYDECRQEAEKINWTSLDASQLSVYIDVLERVGKPAGNIIRYFEAKHALSTELQDRMVVALFRIAHKMPVNLAEFNKGEFFSEEDYFMFLDDCHTAGAKSEDIMPLLSAVDVTRMNVEPLVKVLVSTRSFLAMTPEQREEWLKKLPFSDDDLGIRSHISSVIYDVEEYFENDDAMAEKFDELLDFYNKGAREKSAMLTIAAHFLKHFPKDHQKENLDLIAQIMTKLVDMDSENMLFRKNLHELLLRTGNYADAELLGRESLAVRRRQDKEINDLLRAFHRFYGNVPCPLDGDDNCPLCFGSNERPYFKTICANVSPREVYAEKVTSQVITIDDEPTMKAFFDWQPMHIASPIIASYFHSLGTYLTKRDFPDVLVEGETYIFVRLKKEALARLVNEGYSLSQIDPMLNVLFPADKPKILRNVSKEEKETDYKGIVSAKDFTIEIVRAISPDPVTQKSVDAV